MSRKDELAQVLFEFERVDDDLQPVDVIIGLGSHDMHVAGRAAELYLAGLAPYVLFTGGYGRITRTLWNEPEAAKFAQVASEAGVPKGSILIEDRASNTGENIRFSQELLTERDVSCERIIFVDRPYRGRRTKAALDVQWPGGAHLMASPRMSYDDYLRYYSEPGAPIDHDGFIALMVGDIQRNIVYGERGFQSRMEIPVDVMEAYEELIGLGFTQQLMKH